MVQLIVNLNSPSLLEKILDIFYSDSYKNSAVR